MVFLHPINLKLQNYIINYQIVLNKLTFFRLEES